MKKPSNETLFSLFLIASVFVALTVIALAVAPRLFVLFDEAYNLNVSKTLAGELRYASRIGDWYRPFDPQVTTGPTLLVPVAVAIRLGGATIGTVRLAMALVFMFCLGMMFLGAREFVGTRPALAFVFVAAWVPLALEYGLSVLGDIPAAALGIVALGLLRRSERSEKRRPLLLLLSGLALGLAMLAKDIAALFMVAVALAWAVDYPRWRRENALPAETLLPVLVAGLMATGWRLYQVWAVRRLPALDALDLYRQLAADTARQMWSLVIFAPFSHVGEAWRNGLDYYLPVLLALALAFAGFVALRRHGSLRWIDWGSLAERSLAAGCLLWLVWYFFVSGPQAFNHHLLAGILLAALLVVMLAARLRMAIVRERMLAAALSLALLWSIVHGMGYLRLYLSSSEARLAMQTAAADWIRANTPQDASVYGWGWYIPWHVAFLADRVATRIDPGTADPSDGTEWFVLSPEIAWGNDLDSGLQDFLAHQGTPVLDQRLYPIYRVTWRPR